MKNINWHYIYLPAFAIIAFIVIFLKGALDDKQREVKSLLSANSEKDAKIEKITNALGEEIFRKQAAEVRIKDLENAYPQLAATLEKQFDIKIKNLKAYIENQFVAHGTGTGTITNNHYHYDSATGTASDSLKYKMNDGFLSYNVNFELKFKDKFTITQSPYHYQYSDTAKTVIASNKKFFQFWKNEKLFATTKFSNPNTSLVGATNILVDDYKDKRWSIGIGAGWGLIITNDGTVEVGWYLGPNVSYTLFKF